MPSPAVLAFYSEDQLQSKLNQPFRRSDAALHGLSYLTEPVAGGSAIEAGSWGCKIWMVEEIEELRTELKSDSFGKRDPLKHGEIKVVDTGSAQS